MKRLFATLSTVLATVPGLAIILIGIGVPPETKGLLGGITEAVGGIVLLLLYVNRKRVMELSKPHITRIVASLTTASIISIALYIALFKHCVITHPTHHTIYFPLVARGHLSEIIKREGGRYRALDIYGYHSINTELLAMPGYGLLMALTTFCFIILQQGIANTLVAGFAVLSIHEKVPLIGGRRKAK